MIVFASAARIFAASSNRNVAADTMLFRCVMVPHCHSREWRSD
jgi:hypothetical protein